MVGKEMAFASLETGARMVSAMLKARVAAGLPEDPGPPTLEQLRRPHFAGEWQQLRTAWSLSRNGQNALAATQFQLHAPKLYPDDPPTSLEDWLFRFISTLMQPHYDEQFGELIDAMRPAFASNEFSGFAKYYDEVMSKEHGTRYFELLRSFFAAYDEFAQVHAMLAAGLEVTDSYVAASADFDKTRMFYGNAFEVFASQVDLLAYLNNLAAGRAFDKFERLTAEEYRKLDKAGKFGPFSGNRAFADVCSEADNQLRNASHHGRLSFDRKKQELTYRTGKGGTGPQRSVTYTQYLARCVQIFLQTLLLLRAEIVMAHQGDMRAPL